MYKFTLCPIELIHLLLEQYHYEEIDNGTDSECEHIQYNTITIRNIAQEAHTICQILL